MKSGWNIGKLRKGRLVRAVALLFLFHTGVDLLFPQLCSEEPVNITINQSLPVSKEAINDETSATGCRIACPAIPMKTNARDTAPR